MSHHLTREPRSVRRRKDVVLRVAVLAVLLVLAAMGDDRHVGLIADGRQMIRTAVALTETGEIGQATGRDFSLPRAGGDAVSRFGMATSLLQVPAAWVAPHVEAWRGPGSSQALFLFVPWLGVGLAAAAAGRLARRLGAGDTAVVCAVLLASIASPLGAYATLEFSESVQAAALVIGLLAAVIAAQAADDWRGPAFVAGLAAGLAVLAKSSLIVAAPAVLLPLIDPGARKRTGQALAWAAAGAAAPLAAWAGFEWIRFGALFGGYPDDRFTHSWIDGAWRLIVGPNRGLVWFWPALILFGWTAMRWRGAWLATPAARAWVGAALVLVAQWATAAGYWGWHGMEGWGPRLIVSAIPLLAAFAVLAPVARGWLVGMTVVCTAVNVLPLLQHPTPVATYVMNLPWPAISPADRPRFPYYATSQTATGAPTVVPFEVLDVVPSANPWRVYAWFWRASTLDDRALSDALRTPPWSADRRDITLTMAWPAAVARQIAPRPRVGFLGRSLTGTGGPYATVYLDALLDQVVRANQLGRMDVALALSARRLQLAPDGEAVAWHLESLRRVGRASDAAALLGSLPAATRAHPLINVVLALFDRDAGEDQRARALLRSVADQFPGTPVARVLTEPLTQWPATLDRLTQAERRDALITGPR